MSNTLVTPPYTIQYEGNIEVKVLRNKKVIRERKFKNNGRWPLFLHLVHSLAGNYAEAEKYRPLFIAIYSIPYDATSGKIPQIVDGSGEAQNQIGSYAKVENIKCGAPGTYMTTPEVKYVGDKGIGTASITYSFLVPFSSLIFTPASGGWEKEKKYAVNPFNLICLYCKNNYWGRGSAETKEDTYQNPSAFFFIEDSQDPSKLGSLLPENIKASSNEYSLQINWTLNFSNKEKQSTAVQVSNTEE